MRCGRAGDGDVSERGKGARNWEDEKFAQNVGSEVVSHDKLPHTMLS